MNTTTINRETLDATHHVLERQPAVDAAYVLGSAATGRLRPDSDIDIAGLSTSLRGMVGFRNVAVHQYEQMDMHVLRWVVESGHRDSIRLGDALGVSIRP